MKITTIIFDLGNVVLTNDWHDGVEKKYDEFSKAFCITRSGMKKGWEAGWPKLRTGKITEDEFWALFLRAAGAKKVETSHIKKAKIIWRKYQKPLGHMLELVNKLKKHYRVVALANSGREWLDFKIRKFKLDACFELIVNSGYAGVAKPNPKIYVLIIRKLGVNPGECLFIDDQKGNLLPARKLGMKTILFRGQNDLERKLRRMDIL